MSVLHESIVKSHLGNQYQILQCLDRSCEQYGAREGPSRQTTKVSQFTVAANFFRCCSKLFFRCCSEFFSDVAANFFRCCSKLFFRCCSELFSDVAANSFSMCSELFPMLQRNYADHFVRRHRRVNMAEEVEEVSCE